ncbi:glycosyltransferase family 4 protein [Paracoccus sp. WLY502]|uniref:glycosyltransferase family 4 protein n=1 Tax=Paracoccus yibinensis TaxID=3068891 RepID=UPI002796B0F9|nr:glycosyltransferase family 4 protein [Paracoccus sp. WLY502]MDQ1902465.1 glycosyltransferase family 4 protein [Paracoccus sp. WLY502]
MRITFALPELSNLAGGLRVVAQYTRHLLDQGHSVSFAVRRPRYTPSRKRQILNIMGLGRPTPPLEAERGHFAGIDVPVIHLDESRWVRSQDIPDADAIISTWWTTAEWANRLPPSKGRHIHFIQDYEDFYPEFSKRVRAVYRQRNHKIVVAPWLHKKILSEFGHDSRVVMNGVDMGHFGAPKRDRRELPTVGFMYARHPRKNCGMALQIIRLLRNARPDLHFRAFGVDELPAHSPDCISFERNPTQDRIAQIYRSCDLWLFVSRSEGFGLPLLEAMASRTPVVATPAGAAPDLIDGGNGVIASFDAEAFAQSALDFLSRTPEAWKAASEAAFQTAQGRDLPQAAQNFEAAVLACLQQDRPLSQAG